MPAGVISTVNDSVATKYQRAPPADQTVKTEIKAGVQCLRIQYEVYLFVFYTSARL